MDNMSEANVNTTQYPYPPPTGGKASRDGPPGSRPIFPMPVAITVARGFQALLGFIILILAGLLMHGLAMDANVFALVCGLFTWIIVGYALLSQMVSSCHAAYNYWAILSLDLFMAILWLSSMGANAALRATFVYSVNADCYNDGSAINSGHCVVSRRHGLAKRSAVAGQSGLAEISAIAGLSALQMLLFVATTAYLGHQVRLHLQAEKAGTSTEISHVESKAQSQPMLFQQREVAAEHVQPQYTGQQHYATQAYQQQQAQPYDNYGYAQAQMSPEQQPPPQYQYPHAQSPQPGEPYHHYPPQQQQVYSPAGTLAQQQQYHPPQ